VIAILLSISLVVGAAVMAPGLPCPPDETCPTIATLREGRALPEAIHIFDHEDRPYADVGGVRRRSFLLDSLPRVLVEGFPAVEDRRFRDHGGVDVHAALRASVRNLSAGALAQGASTIPMQLARTLWAPALRGVNPWRRKLIEVRTALALVHSLGRDRVLETYLNAIYLGDGVYGVGAASLHYFGVPVDSIDLAQAATMIAITKSPERYHPRRDPARVLTRRNLVLALLAREGVISREEAIEAQARPLRTTTEAPVTYRRDFVTAAVRRELRTVVPELVGRPGLRVFTTVDRAVQRAGEATLQAQLRSIESGRYGPFQGTPFDEGEEHTSALQGAGIALDPETGAVRAVVGGRSFSLSELDRALQSRRQIGSLVKPLIVAGALGTGRSLADPVSTDEIHIRTAEGVWSPRDHVEEDTLALGDLIVLSSNRAAVRVGHEMGLERLDRVARGLGLRSVPRYPSSFLGAFEASLAEMTAAYAAFGNGGWRVEPHLIRRIEGPDGGLLWERPVPISRPRALDPATAFLVLDALRGAVDQGTAWRVRLSFQGAAAGKTGTTDEGRDAWFVGLTPDLAAGVWIGFDLPHTIVPGADAARLAAPAWGAWMGDAVSEETAPWRPPTGVAQASVDTRTGLVVPPGCPRGGFETRRFYVRTSLRPIPVGRVCPLPPPHPGMLDIRRESRMRAMFRIPPSARRDTLPGG
jgi:penicillin-binding protein 1A